MIETLRGSGHWQYWYCRVEGCQRADVSFSSLKACKQHITDTHEMEYDTIGNRHFKSVEIYDVSSQLFNSQRVEIPVSAMEISDTPTRQAARSRSPVPRPHAVPQTPPIDSTSCGASLSSSSPSWGTYCPAGPLRVSLRRVSDKELLAEVAKRMS